MDVAGLFAQFGSFVWVVAAFVVALSIIVAIHEYGHYIVGRWCGIKADVFSIGFGPVIWSKDDRHGTKWQLAALPFGGYVKFAGDANAASGKDVDAMAAVEDDPAALRHTMHGAPLWARTLTVAAGPVFNFALSILVFFGIAMSTGVRTDPLTVGEFRGNFEVAGGLAAGDEIIGVGGVPLPDLSDREAYDAFVDQLPLTPTIPYDVRRDGQELTVEGPYFAPVYVTRVVPRSAAWDAGVRPGDVITAVNEQPVVGFDELRDVVLLSEDKPVELSVLRDGETRAFSMTPKYQDELQEDGSWERFLRIGIQGGMAFEPATQSPGIGEALSAGVESTWTIITSSINGLGQMIVGQLSTCNLSGPLGIAQTSGAMAAQGLDNFIYFIAVISTAVGLLNLFPIPALDGGHLVFYAYEAVAGKPPSDTALRILMSIGIALVLTLMIFALANDIFCP